MRIDGQTEQRLQRRARRDQRPLRELAEALLAEKLEEDERALEGDQQLETVA